MELAFTTVTIFFFWLPRSPENSSFVLNCLGNDEAIYFDFDFFTSGGYSREKKHCLIDNLFGRYICFGTLILLTLICSNICEIYLTSVVLFKLKKNTASAESMLSSASFALRKRYKHSNCSSISVSNGQKSGPKSLAENSESKIGRILLGN